VIRQVTNSPIHQLHNSALGIIHRVMRARQWLCGIDSHNFQRDFLDCARIAKLKVASRRARASCAWESAKVIASRRKVCAGGDLSNVLPRHVQAKSNSPIE